MFFLVKVLTLRIHFEIKLAIGNYAGFDFDFYAMANSIPKTWTQTLLLNQTNAANDTQTAACACEVISDEVKEFFSNSNRVLRFIVSGRDRGKICGKNFWANKLGVDITDRYNIAHMATQESRLRLLHFKILHNIFPTNILLNRMGIKDSELCEECGVSDFVEHMFIHCKRLRGFWSHVFQLIFQITNTRFSQTDANILLGLSPNESEANRNVINTANHIILIAKMCVSIMRYGQLKHIFLLFDIELERRKKYLSQ